MEINYCEKCHNAKQLKNIAKVEEDIKKIVGIDVKITRRCASYCGPGKKKYFVTINDEVIEADNYEDLLEMIKEEYGN